MFVAHDRQRVCHGNNTRNNDNEKAPAPNNCPIILSFFALSLGIYHPLDIFLLLFPFYIFFLLDPSIVNRSLITIKTPWLSMMMMMMMMEKEKKLNVEDKNE